MTERTLIATPTQARIELAARAQQLRADGMLHREIADELGVSRSYAAALSGEDPLGEKAKERKNRYDGVCVDCGTATSGSEGREKAPERCAACAQALQTAERKWTRESVIDAIQRFAAQHGRPPTATEWINADPVNDYPPRSAVYGRSRGNTSAPFDQWGDAIEAAGFPRPRKGHYVRLRHSTGVQTTSVKGKPVHMRDYIVLAQQPDGSWTANEGIKAYTDSTAAEKYAEQHELSDGARLVAIPGHRWVVREMQPVVTFKAVAIEPT